MVKTIISNRKSVLSKVLYEIPVYYIEIPVYYIEIPVYYIEIPI